MTTEAELIDRIECCIPKYTHKSSRVDCEA